MRLLPEDPDIGWGPYAFLVYLGFVFMGAAFADAGATPWIASCVAIVVFLPMYFVAYWLHGWRRLALATAMALLMFPLATVNASASSFFDAKLRYSVIFATSASAVIVSTPIARTPLRLKRS